MPTHKRHRAGIAGLIALLSCFTPALAQQAPESPAPQKKFAELLGVSIAPCKAHPCGGSEERALPGQIQNYRKLIGSENAGEEPYLPLKAQERAAIESLSDALLRPPPKKDEAHFSDLRVFRSLQDSSFDELQSALADHHCTKGAEGSLSNADDLEERYAYLSFGCEGNAALFTGLSLQDAKITRVYFGLTAPIYAPVR